MGSVLGVGKNLLPNNGSLYDYDACIRRFIPYLLAFLVDTLARTGNNAFKSSNHLISEFCSMNRKFDYPSLVL